MSTVPSASTFTHPTAQWLDLVRADVATSRAQLASVVPDGLDPEAMLGPHNRTVFDEWRMGALADEVHALFPTAEVDGAVAAVRSQLAETVGHLRAAMMPQFGAPALVEASHGAALQLLTSAEKRIDILAHLVQARAAHDAHGMLTTAARLLR